MLSSRQKNHFKVVENGVEYYSVKGLDEVKKEMLRLLSIINKIAKEKNISYWIDGGSLIGVLRHDGFILWDDDLDISILKEDYHRLIDELTRYVESNDDVYLFYKSPQKLHACNFFASKRLFCRTQGSHMLVPVKVDIRPLNCIPDTEESLKENNILRDTANQLLYGKSYGYATSIPQDKKQIEKFFYRYNNEYGFEDPQNENVLLVHPYFEFSTQFKLEYKDLFPLKMHKFENIEVPIPNNYHYLQTNLYGNYMEMPSLEHRAPVACEVSLYRFSDKDYVSYIQTIFNPTSSIGTKLKKLYQSIKVLGVPKLFKIYIYERHN